jgi:hypothetical protein
VRISIGVAVVNWNGLADTTACLDSLEGAAPGPAHIVVVDNGSTDGSLEALRARRALLPTTIIAAGSNRGFAGANNLGVAKLAADPAITHFLLLNNDATVDPTFFAQIAQALVLTPDAGLVGPTIYVTGQPGTVWYAGGHFVPLRALVVHDTAVAGEPAPISTEFVTGCAMLISRRAWERLGPLPECYFIYLEDAEYSWRARAAGLPVLYAPRAVVYHAVGAAVRRRVPSPQVEYWHTRHRALFARRNLRGWRRWGALAYLILTKPARALVQLLRGRPALAWAALRGTASGLLSKQGDRVVRQPPAVQGPRNGVLINK